MTSCSRATSSPPSAPRSGSAYAARVSGHASLHLRQLKSELEDLLAKVELGLDFAHEDVIVISLDDMAARIENLRARAQRLAEGVARETEASSVSHALSMSKSGPS